MSNHPSLQPRRHRPRALGPASSGMAADARRADRSIVIAATVILLAGFALLMWAISDVVLLIFSGVLLAVFLRGISDTVRDASGLPDRLALATVVLTVVTLLSLATLFLGAEIASQFEQLGPRMGEAWEALLEKLREHEWGASLLSERNLRLMMPEDQEWRAHLGGLFSTTLGAVAGLLITGFIGLYGAADPHVYRRGLLALFPIARRERVGGILDDLNQTLRWWLIGTFIKMTAVGLAVGLGLWMLDIPLAMALGLIAFMLDFIPYVGPVLAALPALLVGMALGPEAALHVALLYLAVQTAESYILSPLIDQRSVHLPPALTLASQVLLGALLGALGVVFATPIVASGMVLLRTLYVEDEPAPEEPEEPEAEEEDP